MTVLKVFFLVKQGSLVKMVFFLIIGIASLGYFTTLSSSRVTSYCWRPIFRLFSSFLLCVPLSQLQETWMLIITLQQLWLWLIWVQLHESEAATDRAALNMQLWKWTNQIQGSHGSLKLLSVCEFEGGNIKALKVLEMYMGHWSSLIDTFLCKNIIWSSFDIFQL